MFRAMCVCVCVCVFRAVLCRAAFVLLLGRRAAVLPCMLTHGRDLPLHPERPPHTTGTEHASSAHCYARHAPTHVLNTARVRQQGRAVAFAGPLRHAGNMITRGLRMILVLFM